MKSLASEVIERVAPSLGLTVMLEPCYRAVGQIVTPSGRKYYFRNTNFDLNGQGAAEIAKDKDYAAFFMRRMGYPTPEGEAFFSDTWCKAIGSNRNIDVAFTYALSLGFPVIVKPNSKSQGAGVVKAYTKRDFYQAMRAVFTQAKDRVALVQRPVIGEDYRIVVLDGRVISAYQRLPLFVTGDGTSTIHDLLVGKQAQFRSQRRETVLRLDDYRIGMRLRRLRMTLQTVAAKGEHVMLLDNANLSSGGSAVDVTDVLHPSFRDVAIRLTQDMGLRYCGVDIITPEPIDQELRVYTIVEINAAPGLDHYAEVGQRQREIVERMYEQILRAFLVAESGG